MDIFWMIFLRVRSQSVCIFLCKTEVARLVFSSICTPSSEVWILLEQPENQNNFSFSLTRNFGYQFVRLVCLQTIIQQTLQLDGNWDSINKVVPREFMNIFLISAALDLAPHQYVVTLNKRRGSESSNCSNYHNHNNNFINNNL